MERVNDQLSSASEAGGEEGRGVAPAAVASTSPCQNPCDPPLGSGLPHQGAEVGGRYAAWSSEDGSSQVAPTIIVYPVFCVTIPLPATGQAHGWPEAMGEQPDGQQTGNAARASWHTNRATAAARSTWRGRGATVARSTWQGSGEGSGAGRRRHHRRNKPGSPSSPLSEATSDASSGANTQGGSPCSSGSGSEPDAYAGWRRGLHEGGDARAAALQGIGGAAHRLAFEKEGCLLLQEALPLARSTEARQLVQGLRGLVLQACASMHANHVLQKIIVTYPSAMFPFILEELRGGGAAMAGHEYGCRIFCRLIEHVDSSSPGFETLLEEVLAATEVLCHTKYGKHVIMHVLEHMPQYRGPIARALLARLPEHALNKHASRVVEKALELCAAERPEMARRLLGGGGPGALSLAGSLPGSFVLAALLRCAGGLEAEARGQLLASRQWLAGVKHTGHLFKALGDP